MRSVQERSVAGEARSPSAVPPLVVMVTEVARLPESYVEWALRTGRAPRDQRNVAEKRVQSWPAWDLDAALVFMRAQRAAHELAIADGRLRVKVMRTVDLSGYALASAIGGAW